MGAADLKAPRVAQNTTAAWSGTANYQRKDWRNSREFVVNQHDNTEVKIEKLTKRGHSCAFSTT